MQFKEKLSVVIPLYNKRDTILRAIESVLNQTVSNFTLYVVNDGSVDGSEQLVASLDDSRVVLVSQVNRGVSAARNRGIQEAEQGLVAFLDADDFWDPGLLAEMLRLRAKYPVAKMYAVGYRQVRPDGCYTSISVDPGKGHDDIMVDDYIRRSAYGNFVHSSSVMLEIGALKSIGGFPVGEKFGEDLVVWTKIGARFPLAASRKVLGNFTLDPTGSAPRHSQGFQYHPLFAVLLSIANDKNKSTKERYGAEIALRSKIDQILNYQLRSEDGVHSFKVMLGQPQFKQRGVLWKISYSLPPARFWLRIRAAKYRICRRLRLFLSRNGLISCGVLQSN